MGHKSVTTTEVYSEMNLKRVAQDFPDLVQSYVNKAKIGDSYTEFPYTATLSTVYVT